MEKVLTLLEVQGYTRSTLERYQHELGRISDPALAYFALDSCSCHPPRIVHQWLRLSRSRSSGGAAERLQYVAGLRRRAMKSRPDWPTNRFLWTNEINRAKHYAEKLL